MSDSLDDRRHAIATSRYDSYDFSPYQVETSNGWDWASGGGPVTFTRVVFLIPPRADGNPGDVDTDASVKATFSVTFAHDSVAVTEMRASLDGEDVGRPGRDAADLAITPSTALKAILARIDGRFDEPALLLFGPLMPERMDDIVHIAQEGLRTADAA